MSLLGPKVEASVLQHSLPFGHEVASPSREDFPGTLSPLGDQGAFMRSCSALRVRRRHHTAPSWTLGTSAGVHGFC